MNSPPFPSGSRERSLYGALLFCLIDLLLIGSVVCFSNSVAILSDFLKEFTDFLSVLASIITLRAVHRPNTNHFSYGIGKLENLVSIIIALVMLLCSLYILAHAGAHFRQPVPAQGTLPGIIIFTIYTIIGFAIWRRTQRLLQKQHSAILESQSRLWFSKAAFDAAMAVSLISAHFFRPYSWSLYLDPAASLIGVAFMLHAAYAMTSSSVKDLLDSTLEETTQLRILRQMVLHLDDYDRLHKIRTRRSGSQIYVEIFLEFDPLLAMGQVQKRIDHLRLEMQTVLPLSDVSIVPTTNYPNERG